jgi:rhamnose utilization protein RhaD (predicted bifunctional aldolase and dehydrogenase)
MTLRKQIEDLCAKMGANRLLVQGSGGNVSWKEGNELWVKASGTRLGDAKVDNIFVAVCLKSMRENLSARNFDATAHLLGDSTLRPSIETSLHALLPQKVVFHIHAVDVLAYLVKKDHTSYLESIFNGLLNFVSVDYKKPGAELAEAVYDALQTRKGANVIFLANHGIVVGGDSVDQVEKIIALII